MSNKNHFSGKIKKQYTVTITYKNGHLKGRRAIFHFNNPVNAKGLRDRSIKDGHTAKVKTRRIRMDLK